MSSRESGAKYGWLKDAPDKRDYRYSPSYDIARNLPPKVDLRRYFPRAYNQGNLNSCTANAIAAAIEFIERKQGMRRLFIPSRLFIYYNEREMEGQVDKDNGAQIRDGIKSVAKLGSCHEDMWPYTVKQFKNRPATRCYRQAIKYEVLEYRRLGHDLVHLKSCLASGYPFVFGMKVYSSFEGSRVRKTGHLGMPRAHERLVGKHAVIAVGYDDSRKWFIARNSWGDKWGIKGYFTIPYKYVQDRSLSADLWTIRLIR